MSAPVEVIESVLMVPGPAGHALPGIVSEPAGRAHSTAVIVLVGGPQYRVGSHRQFVQLARAMALGGYVTLRFDYGGMGDAAGPPTDFEQVGPDLRAAVAGLLAARPQLEHIVLWGLCDAASTALMECGAHPQVRGLVLANPWARHSASLAATTVRHYYRGRLLQPELWRKVFSGSFDWSGSLSALWRNLRQAVAPRHSSGPAAAADFRARMSEGLAAFRGPVLLLLSGDDLTAREFADHARTTPSWRDALDRGHVERVDLPGVDHTFSRREWKTRVERLTLDWLDRAVSTGPDPTTPLPA